MAKNQVRKLFVNKTTGHETSTSHPVEQNRLRAQGYVEARPKQARQSASAANKTETKK